MYTTYTVVLICFLFLSSKDAYNIVTRQQKVIQAKDIGYSKQRSSNLKMSEKHLHTASHGQFFHNINKFFAVSIIVGSFSMPTIALARPEGVNRPDLLPQQSTITPLIDTANFLTKGQEKKIVNRIDDLEQKTKFKLRVLCQNYPETPGLAIKDYWKVDDKTVVMVIDKGEGFNRKGIPSNAIHLNIGSKIDEEFNYPQFWQRLTNKLGNNFYIKEKGIDIATINAVEAISYCLEAKDDIKCNDVPFDL